MSDEEAKREMLKERHLWWSFAQAGYSCLSEQLARNYWIIYYNVGDNGHTRFTVGLS